MDRKIGFIGVGNMGGALLLGAVENSGFKPGDIYAHSLTFSDKI